MNDASAVVLQNPAKIECVSIHNTTLQQLFNSKNNAE